MSRSFYASGNVGSVVHLGTKNRLKRNQTGAIEKQLMRANDYYAKALDSLQYVKQREREEIVIIVQTKKEEIAFRSGVHYYDLAMERLDFLFQCVEQEYGKPMLWKFEKERNFAPVNPKERKSILKKVQKFFF